jgi:surface polysaccharide O-acyltransferase-like enzyme
MFLIVLHHLCIHVEDSAYQSAGTLTKVVSNTISWGGQFGVLCFILISGYFLVTSRFHVRSIVKLYAEALLFDFTGTLMVCMVDKGCVTTASFVKALFPISSGTYWFFTVYLAIYLLSPFINKLLRSLTKHMFQGFLVILLFLLCIIPSATSRSYFLNGFTWLLFAYCIGAYHRLHGIRISGRWLACFAVVGLVIIIMATVSNTLISVCCTVKDLIPRRFALLLAALFSLTAIACATFATWRMFGRHGSRGAHELMVLLLLLIVFSMLVYARELVGFSLGNTMTRHWVQSYILNPWIINSGCSLPMLVCSVGCFVAVGKLDLGSIPLLNRIASAVFGVYLIHETPAVIDYYPTILSRLFSLSPLAYAGAVVSLGLVLFCAFAGVDLIRQRFCERPFMLLLERHFAGLFDKVDMLMDGVASS